MSSREGPSPQFVPVVGRFPLYDRAKQYIKHRSPRWVVRAVQVGLRPFTSMAGRLREQRRRRSALPAHLRGQFRIMYAEARAQWAAASRDAGSDRPVMLPLLDSGYQVRVRRSTSDVIVYSDVIIHEQYGPIPISNVRTIVDCGANIGLASAYFLAKYRAAHVLSLEPDPINYELCRQNVEQFGWRATVVCAALWGSCAELRMDGAARGTWASRVASPGQGAIAPSEVVAGYDLTALMAEYRLPMIDLLKIDIEGAELDVFTAPDLGWLNRVRCIAIELESEASRRAFYAALAGRPFSLCQHREVLIAHRTDLDPQVVAAR